jgi:hypothetical protein
MFVPLLAACTNLLVNFNALSICYMTQNRAKPDKNLCQSGVWVT